MNPKQTKKQKIAHPTKQQVQTNPRNGKKHKIVQKSPNKPKNCPKSKKKKKKEKNQFWSSKTVLLSLGSV